MAIFGVLGPEVCISGSRPAFRMRFFATNLGGTMSWGLKPCFSALESGFMTPLFILPSNYQLVVSGGGISKIILRTNIILITAELLRFLVHQCVCNFVLIFNIWFDASRLSDRSINAILGSCK